MIDDIRLEHVESRPLAVVRRCAKLHELTKVVPHACGTVWNVVRSRQIPGAGRNVAVYLDDEFNIEVGVELNAPFGGYGEVVDSATPSGTVVTTIHHGPYDRLPETHEALRRWCANNGYVLAGPNWEIYGHWQKDWNNDPLRITTDVHYLIREGSDGPVNTGL